MMNFILGAVIVFGGWWLIRSFASAQPSQVRGLIRKVAGGALMLFSGFLAMRGGMNLAMPVFLLGLGLMGQQMVFPNGMPWQRKSPGQKSRVTTSQIAMTLDHDTGAMDGEVLAGPFKGRNLTSLSFDEIVTLHAQCAKAPDQSRALLEAWIDRVRPEWRERWQSQHGATSPPASGRMSRKEAYAILGLEEGAAPDQIKSAHRRLMKTVHPDLGGSDYLAAKINEAKDLLLQDAGART